MANLVRRSLFPSARTLSLIGGELTAQFEVLVRGGFAVEHVTTHLQFHVVPSLRRIVLRLAHTYNVAWVRTHRVRATVVPWNPLLPRSLGSPASSSGLPLGPTTLPSSGRPSGPSAPRSADQPLGPAAPQSEDQPHRPAAPQPADLPLDPLASTVSARPLNPAAPATRGVTAPDYMAVLRNWQGREPEALVRTLAGLRGTVELVVHPGIADDPTFPSYITYGPQDRFAETRFLARCWPLLRQITASRSRLP